MKLKNISGAFAGVVLAMACVLSIPVNGEIVNAEEGQIVERDNNLKGNSGEETIGTTLARKTECVHQYAGEMIVDKEATCTEEGIQSIHCIICGESKEGSEERIPLKEHTYGEWIVVEKPTYDSEGKQEQKCVDCGHINIRSIEKLKGVWKRNKIGWWYELSDGSYFTSCRKMINGVIYVFDSRGYMQTGWVLQDSKWSYHTSGGAALTGWQCLGGKWYYLNENGIMTTGWQYVGDNWYYLNGSGAMLTGWQCLGGKWYYLNSSGVMTTDWQRVGGKWYYMAESGVMTTGWQYVENSWYYLNGSGAMAIGWQRIGGKWYYLNGSGAMQTGWQRIGGNWYYFYCENDSNRGSGDALGTMAVNKVIDGWAVYESGKAFPEGQIEGKIEQIKSYVGVPYKSGGCSPSGWDCSGFTKWALKFLGVDIPSTSAPQAAGGIAVDKNNMSAWKPGDILVYKSGSRVNHVALYLGDGLLMHALNAKYGTLMQDVFYYEKWDTKNHLSNVRRYL